jgi:hypothetical protein
MKIILLKQCLTIVAQKIGNLKETQALLGCRALREEIATDLSTKIVDRLVNVHSYSYGSPGSVPGAVSRRADCRYTSYVQFPPHSACPWLSGNDRAATATAALTTIRRIDFLTP